MAAGAIILGTAVAANWEAISTILKGPLGTVTALLSTAALVIGAILTFSGVNIPLGLALLAMGAVGFASVAAAKWDSLTTEFKTVVGALTAILGTALLVMGAIFVFSGANLPLGIGMMIAGAVGLATSVAVNWGTMMEALKGPIGLVTGLIGTAFLVLGAIMAFSGANLPLGIGLLAAGAAALAPSLAANWDTIQAALQGPIGTITTLVSTALLAIGSVLLFSGAAIPLGIGMIAVGAIGLATSIAANWNVISQTLGSKFDAIVAIASAGLLVLGIILLFTGAAIPLGLGMMIAGATGLAVTVAPKWDFILEAIQGAYESMKTWWNTNAAQFFSLEYWAGLAKNMLDGLFGGLKNLGSRISEWGGSFINGVKDFFGIHSPSTEFEGLGGYMMAGLQNGVGDNSEMVVSAFSVMFTAITALCTQNTDLMKAAFVAFLLYLTTEFEPKWMKSWQSNYQNAHSSIQMVMSDIDALNRKLAAIERNITITITTIRKEISEGGGSSSSSKSASPSMARMAAMPAIQQSSIPALAKGAVIPPNRKFLAVLGDQRNGNNLEGPEDMFRNIVRQEMGNNSQMISLLQAILSAVKEGKTIEVDRQTFGRVVHKANSEESRRVGVSFAGG